MPPLSAYSSGIFGITWSPPDPRTRESNAAKYFASVNPDWSAAFDFYIQNFNPHRWSELCIGYLSSHSPFFTWRLSASNNDTGLVRGGTKKRSRRTPTWGKSRWVGSKDAEPFPPPVCVSLCCRGRSWNRHHTSRMQMSCLIWHFQ